MGRRRMEILKTTLNDLGLLELFDFELKINVCFVFVLFSLYFYRKLC